MNGDKRDSVPLRHFSKNVDQKPEGEFRNIQAYVIIQAERCRIIGLPLQ